MKKTEVELITGFLGAGKTSFIQSFINISNRADEEMLIIQCENGRYKLPNEFVEKKKIILKKYKNNQELDYKSMIRALNFYAPKRMIIECNGVGNIDELLSFLKIDQLKQKLKITGIITIIDSSTIEMFLKNMASLVLPNLKAADLIIMNHCDEISDKKVDELEQILNQINLHSHVLRCQNSMNFDEDLKSCTIIKKIN